jgi:hypothetical protein
MSSNVAPFDGDASPPIQANKLRTDIPTPLRNNIARVGDRSENPFFDEIIENDETGLPPSVAYKAIGILTVMVPVTEFNRLIAVSIDDGGRGVQYRRGI